MWLADDNQAEMIEQLEKEAMDKAEEMGTTGKKGAGRKGATAATAGGKRKRDVTLDDMYHEGEGHFEDASAKPSGAATPVSAGDNNNNTTSLTAGGAAGSKSRRGGRGGGSGGAGRSKKAKTTKERLRLIDGDA
ncbi:hypothetical protein EMPG_15834 [Blastomyces silverae]|uniref:Uncharacterized protein n=1 Tax=Blastomyces silverae TaxID=2060906 RepID=A0A0H1BBH3_9EURO|nr:hypothetical protein EMPG_15834 [Blastomyces silverae]